MAPAGVIKRKASPETSGTSAKSHTSRRRWLRSLVVLLTILGALMVLVPAGVVVANRVAFGRFAFWAPPARVDYCGRRYYEQGPESGHPSDFLGADSDEGSAWKQVASTFTGRPIFAVEGTHTTPGAVCTMALYVQDGKDQWLVYPLSGGP